MLRTAWCFAPFPLSNKPQGIILIYKQEIVILGRWTMNQIKALLQDPVSTHAGSHGDS